MEDATITQPVLEFELWSEPNSFGFFQAVRLLERLSPDRAAVGDLDTLPSDEVVRFSVPPSISFPASEIQTLEKTRSGQAHMSVNFMGLTGPLGVLPYHYTLLTAERARARDNTLQEFFGIFHHRIISLFFKAWEKYRFIIGYERNRSDPLTNHLHDVVGLGVEPLKNRLPVPDDALLFYTGLLAPQQRSAVALQQMLEDYFAVPVQIEQFVGAWYSLSRDTQCSLGDDTTASNQLALGAVAGDEIWDQQSRVRVRLGPLSRTRYEEFLPGGTAHEPLRSLVRFFSGDQFEFEVQLVMARDDVPGCLLGADGSAETPLGWCTWLATAPLARDPDDTCLTL
jgi:type VI secretion system protein ImpH